MPNKYNIRAKRQILDNLVRKRAWVQFRNHFDEIITHKDCQAIVEFNNGTTNRTLLHSLCDISNSAPPPADLIYIVAESSPIVIASRFGSQSSSPLHNKRISSESYICSIEFGVKGGFVRQAATVVIT